MNYDELIRNWHAKSSDEDYFSKFVFEYLAFIAYLKRKKFTNAGSDRLAIQWLKQDELVKEQYSLIIKSSPELSEAWEKIKTELDNARLGNVSGNGEEVEEIKWWNYSGDILNQQRDNQKTKGVIHSLKDWENMVEFWYAIRNNLFHGGKNPQDQRDQLLVENGYKTLQPLVAIFLSFD